MSVAFMHIGGYGRGDNTGSIALSKSLGCRHLL